MYTIEELRNLTPIEYGLVNDIQAIKAEILSLKKKKSLSEKAYNRAILNKDFETASEEKTKISCIDDYIGFREEHIKELSDEYTKQIGKYTRDDIKTSWDEYIVKVNDAFKKKHDKFLAVRRELASLYLELAEIQRKAIIDACHVNRLYSVVVPSSDVLWSVDSDLTRPETLESFQRHTVKNNKLIQFNDDDFITALVESGEIPEEKKSDLVNVVMHGLPVHDPF